MYYEFYLKINIHIERIHLIGVIGIHFFNYRKNINNNELFIHQSQILYYSFKKSRKYWNRTSKMYIQNKINVKIRSQNHK